VPCRVEGEVVGFLGMIMNINKHKAAETASEQRERQLRDELALLSETCQVGLSRHGMDGKFLSVNAAWHDITGVNEGEPLDKWHEKLQFVLVSSNQSFPATNFRLLRSSDDRERVEQAWREYVLTLFPSRASTNPRFGRTRIKRESLSIRFRWVDGNTALVQVQPTASGWVGAVTEYVRLADSVHDKLTFPPVSVLLLRPMPKRRS
jgi:PAS domain-containing protein